VSRLVVTVPGTTATVTGTTPMESLYVRARDAAGNLSAVSNSVRAPITTTGPTTGPPSSEPPKPSCKVTYRGTSQWPGGFVSEIQIANTTAAPIENWTFDLRFGGDQTVQNAWGVSTSSQAGTNVTFTPAGWTRLIPPGGSVTIGILGRWAASNAAPVAATLSGAPCALS
jgi:hypothetical protein